MTRSTPPITRRTALRTAAGTALLSVAGCLHDGDGSSPGSTPPSDGSDVIQRVAVEGTALVVEFSSDESLDRVNLIEPNGEVFGQRSVTTGAQRVSFELGTSYDPGEYRVVGLSNGETFAKMSTVIDPELQIRDVGLFRNNPDKPWDDIYGATETDRLKNGEAFVTVENTGTGVEAVVELVFSGGVPNPVENPRRSGMYETERVVIAPGETVDLFSNSFPFGSKSENGVGCSSDGNSGQFTVTLDTQVTEGQVSNTFDVRYSGSTEMSDCEVTITES
ncbi:MAG: hypothetical protein ACOCTH_02065 [Halodesulfurarchaeum sp.]